jgi:hypothetical protein
MAVALRVLVQREPGFRLGWLQQQADSSSPVPMTRPPPEEVSMQRANSLALEEARPQAREEKPKAQVKLQAPLWPANLPGQESLRGSRSAQAKCRG